MKSLIGKMKESLELNQHSNKNKETLYKYSINEYQQLKTNKSNCKINLKEKKQALKTISPGFWMKIINACRGKIPNPKVIAQQQKIQGYIAGLEQELKGIKKELKQKTKVYKRAIKLFKIPRKIVEQYVEKNNSTEFYKEENSRSSSISISSDSSSNSNKLMEALIKKNGGNKFTIKPSSNDSKNNVGNQIYNSISRNSISSNDSKKDEQQLQMKIKKVLENNPHLQEQMKESFRRGDQIPQGKQQRNLSVSSQRDGISVG